MNGTPAADLSYAEKLAVIESYREGYRWLVETGLYNGMGSGMHLGWDRAFYVPIDVSPYNVFDALDRDYRALLGDSATVLPRVLEVIEEPALFWLDAHLVAEPDEENGSPLLAELEAILAWPHAAGSTVLADDVRMMGRDGWPSLEDVQRLETPWEADVRDDILRFTPCA